MTKFLPYILGAMLQPLNIVILILGNIVGLIFGAIPTLSGTTAVMIFLAATYNMAESSAIILLLSLWVGGCSGAFIGSILLGIPGSPSAVATCFDGYPMSQKGQTSKALAIGMVASFTGTFLSAIIGAILSEQIAELAFLMGPWEYFALCLVAITMVIAISKENMFKGLAAASIGLLLTTVGISPLDAVNRFTFGNMYLLGGLEMSTIFLGVFAVSHIIFSYGKGFEEQPEVDPRSVKGIGITLKEIKEQTVNIIRSFAIGLGIGFLPGMGAGLSNLVAYASAKNASKNPELFGRGNPEGVWASEVANNASIGGSMIPMVALGIPGDTTTALLIGALTLHGLEMGPMAFRNSGHIIYLMFATVALCAVVCFVLQMVGMRVFPYILRVPHHYLYSALILLCIVSAYVSSSSIYSVGLMLFFCLVGLIIHIGNLPLGPMILAFVLGEQLEVNMLKAFQYSGTVTTFFTRPISCILMIIAIGAILSPIIKAIYCRLKSKPVEVQSK
jgi:putative tricarboxylic transport membrane protein